MLLQLPLSVLLPASVQIIIVMGVTENLTTSVDPFILQFLFEPSASDVNLLVVYRSLRAFGRTLPFFQGGKHVFHQRDQLLIRQQDLHVHALAQLLLDTILMHIDN